MNRSGKTKKQENENGFIKPADIQVVPSFQTNEELGETICHRLNSHLKKDVLAIEVPKFLVFRPTGRAGDEFKEIVTPKLTEGCRKYLIVAFNTKPSDMFSISEDDKKKLQFHLTRVVINKGRFVTSPDRYHDFNSDSLQKLAKVICEEYSNNAEMMNSRDSRETDRNPYSHDAMSYALNSGKIAEEEILQLSLTLLEERSKTDDSLQTCIPLLKGHLGQNTGSQKEKSKVSTKDSGSKGPQHDAKKEPSAKMASRKPVPVKANDVGEKDNGNDDSSRMQDQQD